MHTPGHSSISRLNLRLRYPPRCRSGPKMIFWSSGIWLMIVSALELVTITSESAFTSVEQLM